MYLYEVSLELPRGHTINVLIAAPSQGEAETSAREMLRSTQEEAILSGRTDEFPLQDSKEVTAFAA